jgi:hypothetical protein
VHSAAVLPFPNPGEERSRPRAASDYSAIPGAVNAYGDVGRRTFN